MDCGLKGDCLLAIVRWKIFIAMNDLVVGFFFENNNNNKREEESINPTFLLNHSIAVTQLDMSAFRSKYFHLELSERLFYLSTNKFIQMLNGMKTSLKAIDEFIRIFSGDKCRCRRIQCYSIFNLRCRKAKKKINHDRIVVIILI